MTFDVVRLRVGAAAGIIVVYDRDVKAEAFEKVPCETCVVVELDISF